MSNLANKPPGGSVLQQFRSKPLHQKIHPRESALIWILGAHLVFLPWALGGMKIWSQWSCLALSLLGLIVALLPRDYNESVGEPLPFRLYTWQKLLKFPVFWFGFLFLGYITVQACNPAWGFVTDGKGWWMQRLSHREWLPTGVDVPIERWGPWRMLIIYASVWCAVCAAWIGFTRRRSLQIFFSVLAGNAFLLAILGIAQRAMESDKMFFLWKPPVFYFVSTFIYKNHAGAYFNLLLALCAGLAFWFFERSQRRLDKSSPSGVFAFFGTTVAMIVFFSYSRTAMLLMAAFLIVIFTVFLFRHYFRAAAERRSPWIVFLLALALVAFARIGLISLRTDYFVSRMGALQHEVTSGASFRGLAAKATWDMAKDRLATGSGAGSFRFLFPMYQRKYPAIFSNDGKRLVWEHAHSDYLELLAELGVVGCAFLLGALGYALLRILRTNAWQNPLALFVFLGCGLTLAHGIVDFPFFNPAVLTTWWVLLFAVIRWVELEDILTAG